MLAISEYIVVTETSIRNNTISSRRKRISIELATI